MADGPSASGKDDLTCDAFLGGRIHLWQPRHGYRAGIDPVLLAASVDACAGQSVLDLGCGAGAAALCLAARVKGLDLAGVERQPEYAALARRNAAANGVELDVHEGDLVAMPKPLKARRFDHVMANPPYFIRAAGSAAPDTGREAARGEDAPLSLWAEAASRRLKPGGWAIFIMPATRLGDLLGVLNGLLGSVQILPLAPREGRDAVRILLRARKGGRAGLRLHSPLVLHRAKSHAEDGGSYSAGIGAVLEDMAGLPFPGGTLPASTNCSYPAGKKR